MRKEINALIGNNEVDYDSLESVFGIKGKKGLKRLLNKILDEDDFDRLLKENKMIIYAKVRYCRCFYGVKRREEICFECQDDGFSYVFYLDC